MSPRKIFSVFLLAVVLVATGGLFANGRVLAAASKVIAAAGTPAAAKDTAASTDQEQSALLGNQIVVSDFPNTEYAPAAAYNVQHDEYLVVWHNTWTGPVREVWASRVSGQGQIIDSFKIATDLSPNDNFNPAVAYDPSRDRYLVVWSYDYYGDGSDWGLYGRFIPWDGPDSNLVEFPINNWPQNQEDPQVAYGGLQDEFLVVWNNVDKNFDTSIYARRVYADGSGFPDGPFWITGSATEQRIDPSLAYNVSRNEYLITFDNGSDIFGKRIQGDGDIILGSGEFTIAGWPDAETQPAVASCPGTDNYLVLWQSKTELGDYGIFARYLAGDGNPGAVLTVHDWIIDEQYPAITCIGNNLQYLAAWEQQDANQITGIWGRMIGTDATMKTAFEIAAAGVGANRTRPALAGGTPSNLAVWENERENTPLIDIYGRLMWPYGLYLPTIQR
jgi:hypothetical protein